MDDLDRKYGTLDQDYKKVRDENGTVRETERDLRREIIKLKKHY